jgi:polysaccharide biosynthesis/export protein
MPKQFVRINSKESRVTLSRLVSRVPLSILLVMGPGLIAQQNPINTVSATKPAASSQLQNPGIPVGDDYRIGVEDDLQVSVWKEPELSVQVVVRPDGMISLPLLNDIRAVGLSTKDLQDLLTEKLKPIVAEPQVTIIVRGIKSRKVYLVGQVARPGAFTLSANYTLLQVLAEAGGVSPYAKTDSIYVLRKSASGQQQKIKFNYKKAIKGDAEKLDFPLFPGDMIVVP